MATDYDILIIGGGMVGATLGCALGGTGLRVGIVEGQCPPAEWPEGFDLRVSALTRSSQWVYESVGAWAGMARRRISPYAEMHVWDAAGDGAIHFDAADIAEIDLGHIVENRVILAALIERLGAFDNVDYLCPASPAGLDVSDDAVVLSLDDGRQLSARLVAGADGSGSWTRERAGITTTGWRYDQSALVATVKTSEHHRDTAWQRFLPDGPLAFLPLTDGHCSIVWSTRPEAAERLKALESAAFLDALQRAFGDTLGRMEWVGERAVFPLMLQHADDYVRPRIALLGNAAHSIHPLAGQGLNLGVSDAAALAEVLAAAHRGHRDIGAFGVLRRYERWRKADNVAVMAAMDAFKRLFGSRSAAVGWLRNAGLSAVDAAAPVKHMLIRRAMGLEGDLPRLCRGLPVE